MMESYTVTPQEDAALLVLSLIHLMREPSLGEQRPARLAQTLAGVEATLNQNAAHWSALRGRGWVIEEAAQRLVPHPRLYAAYLMLILHQWEKGESRVTQLRRGRLSHYLYRDSDPTVPVLVRTRPLAPDEATPRQIQWVEPEELPAWFASVMA